MSGYYPCGRKIKKLPGIFSVRNRPEERNPGNVEVPEVYTRRSRALNLYFLYLRHGGSHAPGIVLLYCYCKHLHAQHQLILRFLHNPHEQADTETLGRVILRIDEFRALFGIEGLAIVLQAHEYTLSLMNNAELDGIFNRSLLSDKKQTICFLS